MVPDAKYQKALDFIAEARTEIKRLRALHAPDNRTFHRCAKTNKVRPYPKLLCSCCNNMGDDFNSVAEIGRLEEELSDTLSALLGQSEIADARQFEIEQLKAIIDKPPETPVESSPPSNEDSPPQDNPEWMLLL